jgi:hypothetical protein
MSNLIAKVDFDALRMTHALALQEIARLQTAPPQRKPLTDESIDVLARAMVKGDKSVNWLCRAIEAVHGIVSSQMQHIADLEAALAKPRPVMLNGLTEAETNASASVMGLTPPQRKPLTEDEIVAVLIASAGMTVKANDVDLRFARAIEAAHGIGDDK